MLANIRLRKAGQGQWLRRPVDLLRFSEEDIRNRLVDTGENYDSELVVMGFEDWEVERSMSLSEAYALKALIQQEYSEDEFIVCHLLKNCRLPIYDVLKNRYAFLSKDEEEAMMKISRNYDSETLIKMFYRAKDWITLIVAFINTGEILNTSRGFYQKVT